MSLKFFLLFKQLILYQRLKYFMLLKLLLFMLSIISLNQIIYILNDS